MSHLIFAPSILAADFTRLGEQVQAAEAAGANWIHIDVMDGRFVPNITFGPLIVEAVRRVTSLHLDVHLMIVEPERYINTFADAGADSISVHYEASPNLHRSLQMIQEAGCQVGVAINPHTPSLALSEVMPDLDLINVMTVNPGFGGQKFLPFTLTKIAELRAMAKDVQRDINIEVDGGINSATIAGVIQAGANVVVAGASVFTHTEGIGAGLAELRDACDM